MTNNLVHQYASVISIWKNQNWAERLGSIHTFNLRFNSCLCRTLGIILSLTQFDPFDEKPFIVNPTKQYALPIYWSINFKQMISKVFLRVLLRYFLVFVYFISRNYDNFSNCFFAFLVIERVGSNSASRLLAEKEIGSQEGSRNKASRNPKIT